MGKKHKKQLKEIQRLQALHQSAEKSVDSFDTQTPTPAVGVESSSANSQKPSNQPIVQKHSHVKRDLVFLVILIVVMIAALIALNWAVDNTGFGSWLVGLF